MSPPLSNVTFVAGAASAATAGKYWPFVVYVFELSHAEYGRAVAFLDPAYRVDGLDVATTDWRQWFERAAALPPRVS